jgi:hypothetical protein
VCARGEAGSARRCIRTALEAEILSCVLVFSPIRVSDLVSITIGSFGATPS